MTDLFIVTDLDGDLRQDDATGLSYWVSCPSSLYEHHENWFDMEISERSGVEVPFGGSGWPLICWVPGLLKPTEDLLPLNWVLI